MFHLQGNPMPDNVHFSLAWRKSSKSTTSNCVEFAQPVPELVMIRDSKDASGPRLRFSAAAWADFTVAAPSIRR